jgi:hypothetical protein
MAKIGLRLRMDEDEVAIGTDLAQLGETAYGFLQANEITSPTASLMTSIETKKIEEGQISKSNKQHIAITNQDSFQTSVITEASLSRASNTIVGEDFAKNDTITLK